MIRLSTVGILDLRDDDGRDFDTVLTQTKRFALLVYLAVTRRPYHRRDALVAMFWPESDAEHAYRALRQALYFLRRAIGEQVFTKRGDDEVGVDASKLVCDVHLFRSAIERGGLEEATSFYRGPFLDAFAVRDAPEFERWVDSTRSDLQREYASALRSLAQEAERRGDPAAAATWWRRLVELDPYNTEFTIGLMRDLAQAGDPAGALQLADEHAARLMRDLGIETPAALRLVGEEIRASGGGSPGVQSNNQAGQPVVERANSTNSRLASLTRQLRRVTVVTVLGLTMLVGALVVRNRLTAEGGSCDVCVAVFPFALTGHDSLEMWKAGAALLLNQDLDGTGQIRTVDHNAILGAVERSGTLLDPSRASDITNEWGSWYVLGSLLALGGRVRLTGTLYRVGDPAPVAAAVADGPTADMPKLTQRLAATFVERLPLGEGQRLANPQRRTDDYDALKAYLRGEYFVRRKEFDSATAAFERAIELDSAFGLPRYRRVYSMGWGGGATAGRIAAQEAYPYRRQLSGVDGLLFDALYALQMGHAEDADRVTRRLVSQYPSNVEAWWLRGATMLWFSWRHGQPGASARAALERALTLDPEHSGSLFYLTWIAALEGNVDEFESRLTNPYARAPFWDRVAAVTLAFERGDTLAQRDLLVVLEDDADWMVNFVALSGATSGWFQNLEMVSRVSQLLTDSIRRSPEAQLLGWLRLARLEVARGRWRQASERLDQAASIAPRLSLVYRGWLAVTPFIPIDSVELEGIRDAVTQWDGQLDPGLNMSVEASFIPYHVPPDMAPHLRPYLIGLLSARLGGSATAQGVAESLYAAITPQDTFDLVHDMAVEVAAYAQMAMGDADSALVVLKTSKMTFSTSLALRATFYMRALSRFLRAEILYAGGEYEEAAGWFGTFAQVRGSHWSLNPWSHFRRGQIYDVLGDHSQAVRNYERFVDQWRDAAPELQEHVEFARERLAVLRSAGVH